MRGASYRLDRAATANDRGWLAFHPHPLPPPRENKETCQDEMRVRTACSGASDPLNTCSRVRQVEGENGEPKGKKKRERRKGSCVKSVNSLQATTTVTSRRTTYPGRVRVSYLLLWVPTENPSLLAVKTTGEAGNGRQRKALHSIYTTR